MGKNRVPEIRFAGFDGEWEAYTLGTLAELINGRAYKQDELLSVGKYKVLRVGNLYTNNTWYYSNMELDNKYYANQGDLLYTWSATFGPHIWHGEKVIFHYHIWKIALTDLLDKDFTVQLLMHDNGKSTSARNGSTMIHATKKGMEEKLIHVPTLAEQTRIGAFFKDLDDTITLHQQELDKLRQAKQGFLQKMFPQKGETVPEIRFPGFSGEWEQQKLEKLADFSKGSGYSKNDLADAGEPIILYGRLYTNYETVIEVVDTFAKPKRQSVISKGNEVIVPASGESAEDIARASVVAKAGIIIGGDLNIIEPHNKISSVFLAIAISNGKQQKQLCRHAQGKSIVHLRNSDLKEVYLQYPTFAEQTRIGAFFQQLDALIALKERELEALRQTKQGFLQKMFVSTT